MALLNYGVGPILKESHNLVAIIPELTFQSLSDFGAFKYFGAFKNYGAFKNRKTP